MQWNFPTFPIENGHVILSLIILWVLETIYPADTGRLGQMGRLRHAARNLTISLINLVLITAGMGLIFGYVSSWAEANGLGLLRMLPIEGLPATMAAIIMLDGWMYVWHRANHVVPFLWRFHSVHHSDPAMDVTTATRFHPGEIAISALLRIALIPLLGVSLAQLLLYDALLYPVIQFHHSNVRIPNWLEKTVRLLIASPAMHRIHHSPQRIETDSNYGSIFSFWDRLGASFRLRSEPDPKYIFGLEGLSSDNDQRITNLLMLPIGGPGRIQRQESQERFKRQGRQ